MIPHMNVAFASHSIRQCSLFTYRARQIFRSTPYTRSTLTTPSPRPPALPAPAKTPDTGRHLRRPTPIIAPENRRSRVIHSPDLPAIGKARGDFGELPVTTAPGERIPMTVTEVDP
ncbi:hypothetical protein GCM10022221_20360 [Actinocorallia aurea]